MTPRAMSRMLLCASARGRQISVRIVGETLTRAETASYSETWAEVLDVPVGYGWADHMRAGVSTKARRCPRWLLAVAMCLVLAPVSSAQGASVQLANLGQPGLESTAPEPQVSAAIRGDCSSPLTVDEANGGSSPCPSGTWPAPDGDWSPTIRVAGGDQIEVTFPVAQTSVAVTATSTYRVGTTTPDGIPVRNFSFGPVSISPTADPARWLVSVPQSVASWGLVAMALTAQAQDASWSDVAFSVLTPRHPDYTYPCGQAYWSSTDTHYLCEFPQPPTGVATVPSGGAPSSPGATASPRASLMLVDAPRVSGRIVRIPIRAPWPGRLTASLRGGGHRLSYRVLSLPAGRTTLRVTLPPLSPRRSKPKATRATLKLVLKPSDPTRPVTSLTRTLRVST